jgi:hypothetical protein
MPAETIAMMSAVVFVFALFAVTIAYAEKKAGGHFD